ncbi:ABC transporter permease [Thermoproteota archaeon]
MTIFHFLIKDLIKRKTKLFFALSGIAVGIAVCITMLSLSEGIRLSFKKIFERRNIDVIAFQKEQFSIINSVVNYTLVDAIKELPEINDAAGSIFDLHKIKKSIVPLYGWPTDSFLFDNIKITKGNNIKSGSYEVIVGETLIKSTNIDINDTLKIKGKKFRIVGVFNSSSLFEKSSIIMPITTFQNLRRSKKGTVSAINVRLQEGLRNKEGINKTIELIENTFPELGAQNVDVFIAEKTKYVLMGEELANLIAIITIIAVILALASTMITSVYEKKKLMGILLALGWQKIDVSIIIFIESLLLTLIGGVIGLGLGHYALDYIIITTNLRVFMLTWNNAFLLKIIFIIAGTGIVSSIIPLLIIINLNPVEVIHNE